MRVHALFIIKKMNLIISIYSLINFIGENINIFNIIFTLIMN